MAYLFKARARASRWQFLIGDGQVTLGSQVIKPNARKVRQLKEGVICGFAGATADAMTLFERLEGQLQAHPETMRACVEMAKAWRMDKYLRRLEAVMIVCDKNVSLTLTGTGDVIEVRQLVSTRRPLGCDASPACLPVPPRLLTRRSLDRNRPPQPEDGIIGIGSGGMYATAAARALAGVDGMEASEIGRRAMTIAADMCVYTNHNFIELELTKDPPTKEEDAAAE